MKWTKGSDTIVVIDDITGNEIVLTVGSKNATVAGKEVTMVESAYVGKTARLTFRCASWQSLLEQPWIRKMKQAGSLSIGRKLYHLHDIVR